MTKQATICTLVNYWLIGLPIGFYLAYVKNMSLRGFWIGLATALIFIALSEIIAKDKLVVIVTHNYEQIEKVRK